MPTTRVYRATATNTVIASSAQTIDINAQRVRHITDTFDQRYTYDSRRRLTAVADTGAASGVCSTRVYTLDARSNRTGKTVRYGTAGACPTTTVTPTETTTHTHDSADRAQDPGLRYDAFGRITTLPAAGGELVNAFHTNDLVASQTQADQRQIWTLDPALRLRTYQSERFIDGAWANAVTKINHYGDGSDEPRWIVEDATPPDNLTRNISGPDGHLAATTAKTGGTTLQLTSLHGDVMATLPVTNGTPGAVTLHSTDEFGVPQNTAATTSRYSWLGAHQRSQDALADTILMGVRLYHPATGRFLSVDPVRGGSATAYDYGFADPINSLDLDGRVAWVQRAWGTALAWGRRALNNDLIRGLAVGIAVGAICVGSLGVGCAVLVGVGAGAALGAANWYVNHRRQNWGRHVLLGAIRGGLQGGIAGGVARAVARRFPVAVSHRSGLSRYSRSRQQYSASHLWSIQRAIRSIRQRRFADRYR